MGGTVFKHLTEKNSFISDKLDVWIGLTDLKEGEFRWIYDQTIAKYKPWYSGHGSRGTAYNCGLMYNGQTYTWLDLACTRKFVYVCESHLCKY